MDGTGNQYLGEDALNRHNALSHPLINLAVSVALFPNLRHFQHHILTFQNRPYREASKIQIFHYEIFSESAVHHLGASFVEFFNLVIGQEAHLAVPVPGVSVSPDPVTFLKSGFRYGVLFGSPSFTGADCPHPPRSYRLFYRFFSLFSHLLSPDLMHLFLLADLFHLFKPVLPWFTLCRLPEHLPYLLLPLLHLFRASYKCPQIF